MVTCSAISHRRESEKNAKYQGLVSIQKETSYFTSTTLWYVTIRYLLRYWKNPQLLSNAGTWWLLFSLHYSYYHEYNYIIHIIMNTRRNTWSRYAWLTGHERRWGCARTSIGIDSAAEVAISKCNYIILNTWADIRGFTHTLFTIFGIVRDAVWFQWLRLCKVKSYKMLSIFLG